MTAFAADRRPSKMAFLIMPAQQLARLGLVERLGPIRGQRKTIVYELTDGLSGRECPKIRSDRETSVPSSPRPSSM
jgi:hypothetical protein